MTCSEPDSAILELDPGSYRDRSSRVFHAGGTVYRALNEAALADWHDCSSRAWFRRAMAEGRIVRTELVSPAPDVPAPGEWAGVLRHETIPWISYPYEWTFGMLRDAALLHLALLREALTEGGVLKDSSAYNIQWNGTGPVFIDVPSFVRLEPGEPWLGYRQFCQMFLNPLLLQSCRGIHFQPLLRGRLDGIEPDQCLQLLTARDLLRRGVLTHVYLHTRLQQRAGDSPASMREALRSRGFHKTLIERNVAGLTRVVESLRWKGSRSSWAEYPELSNAAGSDGEEKSRFVESVARSQSWGLAWDLGCNTGRYARLLAPTTECVVAMDRDAATVETLYRELRKESNRRILPLVIDLADSSPNMGWRGRERRGLAERGRPDLILCLALVHHLVIGANIPLDELLEWLAGLEGRLIIEFVSRDDPMVRALLRNKSDQYADYTLENFERVLTGLYDVVRRQDLPSGTRTLFDAIPK